MASSINPQIFREYDIRGIVGKDLTPESVTSIGKAIGSKGKTVEIGKAYQATMGKQRETGATPGRTSQGDMTPHRVVPSISGPAVREHTDFTDGFPAWPGLTHLEHRAIGE